MRRVYLKKKSSRKPMFFDAGLCGWIRSTVAKERWKLPRWMGVDDFFQEGVVVYCKCVRAYRMMGPTPRDDKRRFMAYFKVAFTNRLIDLAVKNMRTPEWAISSVGKEDQDALAAWDKRAAGPATAELEALLALAPPAGLFTDVSGAVVDRGEFSQTLLMKYDLPNDEKGYRIARCRVRETSTQHYRRVRDFLLEA